MTAEPVTSWIDLDRYPIATLDTAVARDFLADCRRRFADEGALVLPGFVRDTALSDILAEALPLISRSYYCAHSHNVYLSAEDPALPGDHPRNHPVVSDVGGLADDLIPAGSKLRAIYNWGPLRGFLATLLGHDQLYCYDDPLGSLNINTADVGRQLGWHFDNAEFATTILLQAAQAGGVFEYLPAARTPDDQGYERVGRVLTGDRDGLRLLAQAPGSLVLFRGRHALHRVTPVEGGRPRIVAILSYDTKPGVRLTEFNRQLFYGRVA